MQRGRPGESEKGINEECLIVEVRSVMNDIYNNCEFRETHDRIRQECSGWALWKIKEAIFWLVERRIWVEMIWGVAEEIKYR